MPDYNTSDWNGWRDSAPRSHAWKNQPKEMKYENTTKPMSTPSDTPRTDAEEVSAHKNYEEYREIGCPPFSDRHNFDFACQLERELNDVNNWPHCSECNFPLQDQGTPKGFVCLLCDMKEKRDQLARENGELKSQLHILQRNNDACVDDSELLRLAADNTRLWQLCEMFAKCLSEWNDLAGVNQSDEDIEALSKYKEEQSRRNGGGK